MIRPINAATLALVKEFEGLQVKAYKDEVGVWTIGWGHTGLTHQDGTVHGGRVITAAEADQLLAYDLGQFAAGVGKLLKPGLDLNDNMFGALVSFAFNLGLGNFEQSTLRHRVNAGRHLEAASEFGKWTRAGGRVLRGLVRRRQSEANLYCSFPA